MTKEEYLEKRVHNDLAWYDKRAGQYRFYHLASRILVITFSAAITVVVGSSWSHKDIVVAILSSIVVITTGLAELLKFKEQWQEYRSTAELIKGEIFRFETGTEPYNTDNNFSLLVKNYEAIIQEEHKNWRSYIIDK